MLTIVGILFGVFLLGLVTWILWIMATWKKRVEGKVYCSFLLTAGGRQDLLLPAQGGWVAAPKWHSFEGGGEPLYAISEDTSYNMQWPPGPGWPGFMKVTVRSATYFEGNQEPVKPPSKDPLVTPDVLSAFRTSKFAQALVQKGYEHFGGGLGAGALKPVYLYLALGLLAVLGIGAVVIGVLSLSEISDLRTGWGM